MSNPKYRPLRGHVPLRVPEGWNEQSRALVVQLEHLLDDIYSRFQKVEGTLQTLDDGLTKFKSSAMLLIDAPEIPNGTDFNTLMTAGSYGVKSVPSARTMVNIPVQKDGALYVQKRALLPLNNINPDLVQQIYITASGKLYVRHNEYVQTEESLNAISWTEWDSYVMESE